MNIFYLAKQTYTCAEYHCDKHVVKMIVEYAQICSTVSRILGQEQGYKTTHKNHPCVKWALKSLDNWLYVRNLGIYLANEYQERYGKEHKTANVIRSLVCPYKLERKGFTPPPKCMPDKYKTKGTIQSYRNYYNGDKARFAKWKSGKIPYWFKRVE